ncbi:MAG: four helix bundle protein [Candidatus Margulisbacteria bacterium]|nr:four helix bundle protein [Candidatus Margulisiibacteriota bacterium]
MDYCESGVEGRRASGSGDQEISGKEIRGSEDQMENDKEKQVVAGFEKLWVWQKAHQLMLEIHIICRTLPRDERFRIRDQIERSSSSVPDNIAEGHTSFYYKDKIKGFFVARKEAGETQNHIRAIQGKCYLSIDKGRELIARYEEVIRGINGYINWVRGKAGAKK